MSARYSDRFREGATPRYDVLDVGGPDASSTRDDLDSHEPPDLPVVPTRRWHTSGAARVALVLVFVVGAAAGAYGWERLRDHQATVAAMGRIDLAASTSAVRYTSSDQMDLDVQFSNGGDYPLTIHGVEFALGGAALVERPDDVSIDPGESAIQRLRFEPDCQALDARVATGWRSSGTASQGLTDLLVKVETADGEVSSTTIPWNMTEMSDWLVWRCQAEEMALDLQSAYGQFVAAALSEDSSFVRAQILISGREDDPQDVEVTDILPGSAAYAIEHEVGEGNPLRTPISLEFRVQTCELAVHASEHDMGVTIHGRFVGGPDSAVYVDPSVRLAAELTRLAERACPV